jgi:hypothetical protein
MFQYLLSSYKLKSSNINSESLKSTKTSLEQKQGL